MNSTTTSQRDIRYQSLMTSLAILLFLTGWYFHAILSQTVYLASDSDMELPLLTSKLASHPLLTMLLMFVMMLFTIVFAWLKRLGSIGAVIASAFLLFQGIALIILMIATKLPWIRLMQSFSE